MRASVLLFLAVLVVCVAARRTRDRAIAIDGDTFRAPSGERVRLQNIDAPELHERGGSRAKWALQRELDSGVRYERVATDAYGRTVARLVDKRGTDVGRRLVRRGFGLRH